MKVLILKPSSLGDVVHALPVLRLLRLHLPQAEIHWWLDTRLNGLFEGDPDLTSVIPFDRRRWKLPWHWHEVFHSARHLRQLRLDWVLDLQGLARSGIAAWLANGGLIVGVDDPREGAPGFHDVSVPRPSAETHAVDWYLRVLARLHVPIDRPHTWLPERPAAQAALREKWHPEQHRWFVLTPGARWATKRWPLEHFTQLLRLLAADWPEHHFVILGGREDMDTGRRLAAVLPERTLDLTNRTTLSELIEWIRLGELMVTNDTGPMHMGAAMKRPVVAIFGPTNPRRTGPYGQVDLALRHPLPCAPCMSGRCRFERPLECLRAITPDRVANEVQRRLAPG